MNADGSGEIQLTHNDAYDFEPDWSPDGTKITWRTGQFDGIGDVAVMSANGTGVANLTNDPAYDREPAWSPDGARIAYASVQTGNIDIRTMNTNGTGKTTLTTRTGNDYQPDWSTGVTAPPSTFGLIVSRQGAGSARSGVKPAGIRCGTDCRADLAGGDRRGRRAFPARQSGHAEDARAQEKLVRGYDDGGSQRGGDVRANIEQPPRAVRGDGGAAREGRRSRRC